MASTEEYARWIVDNQDKQGTPDFEIVAKAYQLAKQGDVGTTQVEPAFSSGGSFVKGLNVGLTNVAPMMAGAYAGGKLGAPLGPWGVVGGAIVGGVAASPAAKPIRRGLEALIPGSTYENLEDIPALHRPWARAGEVVGASAPIAAAPFAVTKAITELPSVVRPIVEAARAAPKTFAGMEAGTTFGAAQGAALAEIIAPGSPGAAIAGEVAGGFVNPIGLAGRRVQRLGKGVIDFAKSFSPAGREARAAELLQNTMRGLGEDPAAVAAMLREADTLGVSLSASQKADSPTLIAFETTLAAKNPQFDNAMKLRNKENLEGIRNLISQMEASGNPELLRIAAKTRDSHFRNLIEDRLRAAQTEAQKTAQALGGDKAAASTKATQIVENALEDARKVERALWDSVPKDHPLAGTGIMEAHANVRAGMLPEEPLPPSFVEQFVARVKDGNGISSGDALRFRSQMLMKAREARGQQKWGEARIYEDMADGALADIAEIPGNTASEARAWSKQLHDTFTRTFAGEALAVRGTGAERIAPEAVLEREFGSGGAMASRRFSQLQEAATMTGQKTGILCSAAVATMLLIPFFPRRYT